MTGPAAVLFEKEMRGNAQLHLKEPLPILYPIVGYRYCSGAILLEDEIPPTQGEVELLEPLELHGLPGSRIPHLWLERQGQRISTLDLLDGRFVLLAGPDGGSWCEAAAAVTASLGIKVMAYRIGPDADLLDLENSWRDRFSVSSEGAVLIRPDGFVAWSTSSTRTLTATASSLLEQVFAHILCRPTVPTRL
jgi:hypothetical protein